MVDCCVWFITSYAYEVAAYLCGDAGCKLAGQLQSLAALSCALAFFPSVAAETFAFEVFFG